MNYEHLATEFWSFLDRVEIRSHQSNASNSVYFLEGQTEKFVLKIYGDTVNTEQIQYELSLLTYLSRANLSFAIAAPIPTDSGETLVEIDLDDENLKIVLFPQLFGQSFQQHSLPLTFSVGQTLGQLHLSLKGFDREGKQTKLAAWGDLSRLHPLVPDPLKVPQFLNLSDTQQNRLLQTLTEVSEANIPLYQTLPIQTIHADYLPPNLLYVDDFTENKSTSRVVGILDFEFATRDLRLMDYLCGLEHFAQFPWQDKSHWEAVKAFHRGYKQYVSLINLEVEAIATVWRLQWVSSIIYWTGWFREGKVTHQSIANGVSKMLLLEDWLKNNTAKLQDNLV